MLTLYSFLQDRFQKGRTKAGRARQIMSRHRLGTTSAVSVALVVALTAGPFGGSGAPSITAFAETNQAAEETEAVFDMPEGSEGNVDPTKANIQIDFTDLKKEGQQLVGEMLAQNVKEQEELQKEAQDSVETAKQKIEEEEARKAEEEAQKAAAVVSYSEADYNVLLRIVQAEAGICDDKGKILVANVILNRVRSDLFPNTITEVVYQRSQFSPVSNGAINTCVVTQSTIDCVNRALAGEDYSQGALYFMYRGGSRSGAVRWFDHHLTFLFQHERHEFFK